MNTTSLSSSSESCARKTPINPSSRWPPFDNSARHGYYLTMAGPRVASRVAGAPLEKERFNSTLDEGNFSAAAEERRNLKAWVKTIYDGGRRLITRI